MVKCTNVLTGIDDDTLTVNKEYSVIRTARCCNIITIKNDKGLIWSYPAQRFEKA